MSSRNTNLDIIFLFIFTNNRFLGNNNKYPINYVLQHSSILTVSSILSTIIYVMSSNRVLGQKFRRQNSSLLLLLDFIKIFLLRKLTKGDSGNTLCLLTFCLRTLLKYTNTIIFKLFSISCLNLSHP